MEQQRAVIADLQARVVKAEKAASRAHRAAKRAAKCVLDPATLWTHHMISKLSDGVLSDQIDHVIRTRCAKKLAKHPGDNWVLLTDRAAVEQWARNLSRLFANDIQVAFQTLKKHQTCEICSEPVVQTCHRRGHGRKSITRDAIEEHLCCRGGLYIIDIQAVIKTFFEAHLAGSTGRKLVFLCRDHHKKYDSG